MRARAQTQLNWASMTRDDGVERVTNVYIENRARLFSSSNQTIEKNERSKADASSIFCNAHDEAAAARAKLRSPI